MSLVSILPEKEIYYLKDKNHALRSSIVSSFRSQRSENLLYANGFKLDLIKGVMYYC